MILKINLIEAFKFSFNETQLLKEAVEGAQDIVNSEIFKRMVVYFHYTYTSRKFFRKQFHVCSNFYYTKDNNQEVFYKFMGGHDDTNGPDGIFQLKAVGYRSSGVDLASSNVGPEKENYIKFNLNVFSDIHDIRKTLIHEYCHRLGYGHPYLSNTQRISSVPYGIGAIVKKLSVDI